MNHNKCFHLGFKLGKSYEDLFQLCGASQLNAAPLCLIWTLEMVSKLPPEAEKGHTRQ